MQIDRQTEKWSDRKMTSLEKAIDSQNSPEAMIVAIARDKCRASFSQLFKLFAPKIKAFVMAQGLNGQMAEELAQDTMLSVWRKAHLFDPKKAKASTWIYTIARNLRIDLARKEARKKPLPENLWHDFEVQSADNALINEEDNSQIRAAISQLSQDQQEVLKLSFFENLSHSETANALGLPLGTVKSRIRIAVLKLKEMIAQKEGINE